MFFFNSAGHLRLQNPMVAIWCEKVISWMRQQFAFIEVVSRAIKSFSLEYNKFLVHSSCDLCSTNKSEYQMAYVRHTGTPSKVLYCFSIISISTTISHFFITDYRKVPITFVPYHLLSYHYFSEFCLLLTIANKYSHLTPARLEKWLRFMKYDMTPTTNYIIMYKKKYFKLSAQVIM